MDAGKLLRKAKRKMRAVMISLYHNAGLAKLVYISFWHSIFRKPDSTAIPDHYLTARPNPGAGIGHQIANWIAGRWFAEVFKVRFADSHFPNSKWDNFLGFSEGEVSARHLIKRKGYRKVALPVFNEQKPGDLAMIRKIIASYNDRKVVFFLEQDQLYREQFGVMNELSEKFHNSLYRTSDNLTYQPDCLNIAVHIRRSDTDVLVGEKRANKNLRSQDSASLVRVLDQVVATLPAGKTYKIYIFSKGKEYDFEVFKKYENLQFCLKMDDMRTFLHLVKADLLITSKSSFSYMSALLSRGIRICPANFRYGYPDAPEWILADDKGNFNQLKLELLLK